MAASERAQRLIDESHTLSAAHNTAYRRWREHGDDATSERWRTLLVAATDARNALLAYVADLEACAAAGRSIIYAETYTTIAYDEALADLKTALAALDRPEDEE